MTGGRQDGARHAWPILAVLATLMAFASVSTDIYLPAMPSMERALGAAPGQIEWTISGYLIGFSIGQLFWGPIGDRYGRRRPVAIGLLLFMIGAAGCALAGSAAAVIACRVVQAFGAAACVVLGRAMVRDLYEGDQAARMMSTLFAVMTVAPLVGPFVGAEIVLVADWRWIFWTLVGVGAVSLAATLAILPETLAPDRRSGDTVGRALAGYAALLGNRHVLVHAAIGGSYYVGLFAFIAGSPFAFIDHHGVDEFAYAALFGAAMIGILAANLVNRHWVVRLGTARMLRIGGAAAALCGLATAAAGFGDAGGLLALAAGTCLFTGLAGFLLANSVAGGLASFPERAGAVSALLGAAQYGGGVIGSGLVGLLADGTAWPMAALMAASGLACWLATRLTAKGRAPLAARPAAS